MDMATDIPPRIRKRVEKRFGYVTPTEWRVLFLGGWIEDAEIEDNIDSLVGQLTESRRIDAADRESRDLARAPRGVGDIHAHLRERCEAISSWAERVANENPDVIEFRREHLQVGRLEPTAVAAWILGRYPAGLPSSWPYDSRGVEWGAAPSTPWFGPSPAADPKGVIDLEWCELDDGGTWKARRWPVPSRHVLATLAKLSDQLASTWRWRRAEAATFVLTGDAPAVLPITGRYERNLRLGRDAPMGLCDITTRAVIEVEPCVTPEELAAWWRRVRSSHLQKRWRPMKARNLRLAAFLSDIEEDVPWPVYRRAWNEHVSANGWDHEYRYDSGRFETDESAERNFERDARASLRRLFHVGYE